jgi:hypothetical protein
MIRAAQTHAKPSSNRCRERTSIVNRGGPSVAGQQAFDGGVRLMREPTTLPPSRKPLTQNI